MDKHLKIKLSEAKRAINSVWSTCIQSKLLTHSSKQKIIRTTAQAILLYAAQVWGYSSFDPVEKFQRYCIKRVFRLPNNTPNYMLHLETGCAPLVLETLKMHFDYVVKVMDMGEERMPKVVLKYMLSRIGHCVNEWQNLANCCGCEISFYPSDESSALRRKFTNIIEKYGSFLYNRYVNEAQSSLFRMYYSKATYNLQGNTYFLDKNGTEMIRTIFMVRGELVNLNYVPHRPDLPILCDICNRVEREDVFHFIAVCPVLNEIRMMYFGVMTFSKEELMNILNGHIGWDVLYKYVKSALSYRKRIREGDF